jgi:hypothetical protein
VPAADEDAAAAIVNRWATTLREAVATRNDPALVLRWSMDDRAVIDRYLTAYRRDAAGGAEPAVLPYRAQLAGAYLFEVLVSDGGHAPCLMDPVTSSWVEKNGERRFPWADAWERLTKGTPLAR